MRDAAGRGQTPDGTLRTMATGGGWAKARAEPLLAVDKPCLGLLGFSRMDIAHPGPALERSAAQLRQRGTTGD